MKKNKLFLIVLSFPLITNSVSSSVVDGIKNIAYIYADQAILGGVHAAGHVLSAKLALLMGAPVKGSKTINYSLSLMPYLKIPYAIIPDTPYFLNKKINTLVDLAGPLAGIISCYIRLKINNIYTEYSSKKTIAQNIKAGLSKPFYKGHPNLLASSVGLRTLVDCMRLIPGQRCTIEEKA